MNFHINTAQKIEKELLENKVSTRNFPKVIDFPFPESYRNLATQIKTTELSSDCILYNSVEAINETNEFDSDTYWCFGGDGQGNRWLFDKAALVFYYDHDYYEGFDAIEINFDQWLQMADLTKQIDEYLEEHTITKEIEIEFNNMLNSIHPDMSMNFPYEYLNL